MCISINRLQESDAEELFTFETYNRAFFEQMVPSRGEAYYQFETFKVRHRELLTEQDDTNSRFYLIRDERGNIVGRINLVAIDEPKRVAEVGFRVGENYVGKGIASNALKQLLETEKGFQTIKGKTTSNNIASQKTMENNGFKKVGISEEVFEFNGEKVMFVHYIWERTEIS
ncbi:GNAT family N-acetyltransferase [Shouchella clausii]|uniref:GNAT family N-acetyltransferase n=1 Tax=Shouchella clausii TaxID=79880 RepID=UPI000BA519C7|nr:GNAT family N-acetyltransferase [Shouchella clausii]PAD92862.1 GNAT family N-acetyltransferase [Shouchella clausii]